MFTADSYFFVLGKPLSASEGLPLGFDIGIRGMSVGEKRRILLPPSLSFNSARKFELDSGQMAPVAKGQPLVLEVTLLSINGLATP